MTAAGRRKAATSRDKLMDWATTAKPAPDRANKPTNQPKPHQSQSTHDRAIHAKRRATLVARHSHGPVNAAATSSTATTTKNKRDCLVVLAAALTLESEPLRSARVAAALKASPNFGWPNLGCPNLGWPNLGCASSDNGEERCWWWVIGLPCSSE